MDLREYEAAKFELAEILRILAAAADPREGRERIARVSIECKPAEAPDHEQVETNVRCGAGH